MSLGIDTITASELGAVNEDTRVNMLGMIKNYVPYDTEDDINELISAEVGEAMYVRNRHSDVLTRGMQVLWSTASEGVHKAVGAPAGNAGLAAGVVPWTVPVAGVPVGGFFWMIRKGVAKVISDGGNDVAAGAHFQSATGGKASAHTNDTNDFAIRGVMIEALGATDGALKLAYVNCTKV